LDYLPTQNSTAEEVPRTGFKPMIPVLQDKNALPLGPVQILRQWNGGGWDGRGVQHAQEKWEIHRKLQYFEFITSWEQMTWNADLNWYEFQDKAQHQVHDMTMMNSGA